MDGVLDHTLTQVEEQVSIFINREEFPARVYGGEGKEGDSQRREMRCVKERVAFTGMTRGDRAEVPEEGTQGNGTVAQFDIGKPDEKNQAKHAGPTTSGIISRIRYTGSFIALLGSAQLVPAYR